MANVTRRSKELPHSYPAVGPRRRHLVIRQDNDVLFSRISRPATPSWLVDSRYPSRKLRFFPHNLRGRLSSGPSKPGTASEQRHQAFFSYMGRTKNTSFTFSVYNILVPVWSTKDHHVVVESSDLFRGVVWSSK